MDANIEQVVIALRQINRAAELHSKKLTRHYGLTGPQLLVLNELKNCSHLSISQVAKNISLSQATVTTILDRLQNLGFVQRVRNTTDKRKVNIVLSGKALDVMAQNPSPLQEDFVEQFSALERWEQNLLVSSLQRIAHMMRAEKLEPPETSL